MIKKTFICVAGVLAGVSGAAYVDGVFERENVLTIAQEEVGNQFSRSLSPESSPESSADASTLGAMPRDNSGDPAPSSLSVSALAESTASSLHPPKDEMASRTALELLEAIGAQPQGSSTLIGPSQQMDDQAPKSKERAQADGGDELDSTEENNSNNNDSSLESVDQEVALTRVPSRESNAESNAELDVKGANSLALLDVRFTRETFNSPSRGQLKYRKLAPQTVGRKQPLPLVVFLHGLGERGDDNISQLKHGLDFLTSHSGLQQFPATIIAPQCPQEARWTNSYDGSKSRKLEPTPTDVMRLTMELIDQIQLTDNVDPNRVYITGLSMGGFGVFDAIARRPSTFAAAVPLCGGSDTSLPIINRIKTTPLWIIHGDQDPVVNVDFSRRVVKALKSVGSTPLYSELAGFKHNVWDAAYADIELYKWMFNQSKSGGESNATKPLQPSEGPAATVGSPTAPTSNSLTGNSLTGNSLTPADAATDEVSAATKSLRSAFQGEWKVLAATRNGRRADSATLGKMRVVIHDDVLLMRIGDRIESANFKLGEDRSGPYPWIDMMAQQEGGRDSAGIFAMQEDKLVICWAVPGAERPTRFNSQEGIKTLVLERK